MFLLPHFGSPQAKFSITTFFIVEFSITRFLVTMFSVAKIFVVEFFVTKFSIANYHFPSSFSLTTNVISHFTTTLLAMDNNGCLGAFV
jgi:hypothetical protein